jgi:hypothetical protein
MSCGGTVLVEWCISSPKFSLFILAKLQKISHYLVVNCASSDDDGRSQDFCSFCHCHPKMAHAGFVVMSSRKMKTMDEGQFDRRRLAFLVEKEMGILRKIIKRLVGNGDLQTSKLHLSAPTRTSFDVTNSNEVYKAHEILSRIRHKLIQNIVLSVFFLCKKIYLITNIA